MAFIVIACALAIGSLVLYWSKLWLTARKGSEAPLPPGPRALPLLGNLADLPQNGAPDWEHWLKHKHLYGPISSVTVFGTTIVILSAASAASEILDRRGGKYSSRPDMVFAMQMCGWTNSLGGQRSPARLRAFRQRIHKAIGSTAALRRYYPLQEGEAHRFLLRLLRSPEELTQHIRTEAGAIILKMTYGYTIETMARDPLVDIADDALAQFSAAAVPGAWVVDTVPVLRYLPIWFPGAGFKKTARLWHQTLVKASEWPMRFVRTQMANGASEECYVKEGYDTAAGLMAEEDDYVLKWSAFSLYAGGADTSVIAMETFFLAMTLYPDIQVKAREEIDRIVGTHRLPSFEDRPKLPYVEAVLKESFRWHPVAPMGLPHVSTADDIYEGYFIPKGSMVLANIWAFTHDADVYPNPMAFNPDRFLGESMPPDPRDYAFGFGRRICPGKLLADSSVWITVARSLATLVISKPEGASSPSPPMPQFMPGVISHPYPFGAKIECRSPEHEKLICDVEQCYPWQKSSAEALQNIEIDEASLAAPF